MSDTYGNDDPDAAAIADAEHATSLLTAEMSDAEAIETLVRTDEHHLSDDEKTSTRGVEKVRTQGEPGMFHALSQIDDGVFVAWSTCNTCSQALVHCQCKNGPGEPKYVTKWRASYFENKEKKEAEEIKRAEKRAEKAAATLAATVDTGLETATAAVAVASNKEN